MPLSADAPRLSTTNKPETSRCTASVISTVPGSAAACTRAAILGASPNTSASLPAPGGVDVETFPPARLELDQPSVPGPQREALVIDRGHGQICALGDLLGLAATPEIDHIVFVIAPCVLQLDRSQVARYQDLVLLSEALDVAIGNQRCSHGLVKVFPFLVGRRHD